MHLKNFLPRKKESLLERRGLEDNFTVHAEFVAKKSQFGKVLFYASW